MDLGLKGRSAIVCGASRGLGRACAESLAREGVNVVMAARRPDVLELAAKEIRAATGAAIKTVPVDVTTPEGRSVLLTILPDPDILVTNAGGPPPGDFRDWDRAAWIKALDANMLSPIELIKATVDAMIARKFGRIVNITSAAVKAPIDVLGLSNGARAGLTGFVAGLARQIARHNVTINNLLPGPFDTDRLRTTMTGQAKAQGVTLDEAMERRRAANPAGRFGDPAEFGDACVYLCAAQAGYITGQNLVIDGGAFPGTL
ncbi:3-oxoacyl- acyl-carrier protein reductase [Paramagnetospirillum magnetotacticum MS-1]|uniref:3-oxoacyl-acyl-carrier protein reductase n=1 Tax=Paramagnetospirillum magnetotacticum MS-1 TaxID=272627 RepID=A0A0C2UAF9_PARME|nr:SDR family oxidoreductase [Paramagnetospirillum magnetotacticum]KIL98467.1 3-oxoacyl- acyl-carrier protein reductase [Paramagnetospirillum magnetotacticum MS-1]